MAAINDHHRERNHGSTPEEGSSQREAPAAPAGSSSPAFSSHVPPAQGVEPSGPVPPPPPGQPAATDNVAKIAMMRVRNKLVSSFFMVAFLPENRIREDIDVFFYTACRAI
jgi:hypothetical protein